MIQDLPKEISSIRALQELLIEIQNNETLATISTNKRVVQCILDQNAQGKAGSEFDALKVFLLFAAIYSRIFGT